MMLLARTAKLGLFLAYLALALSPLPVEICHAQAPAADSEASKVEEFEAEDLEYFESHVRPLLAEKCWSCHSDEAGISKGGLQLDSRTAALEGGDSGPAVVPGDSEASLLIEAVRRESYEMPPDQPLTPREVETLVQWIERRAAWTRQATPTPGGENWQQRRAREHWAWHPVSNPAPPRVQDNGWSLTGLDRFVWRGLQNNDLQPSESADAVTLLRRVHFDLTGLPPSPELTPITENGLQEEEYRRLVDSILTSPQFGAHWGRHWLDLVRYAETLGHEFDYPARYAWRYRDAIIDAFNTDVPYQQLIREHLAGDLISTPRLHPLTQVNQSLALTGWWWLGDSVHAPVDVTADWATRTDNQIDVMSKAFMGLTVACARCHDHKFDAISTEDYYALAGVIQSCRRDYAITDPGGKIAQHNETLMTRIRSADQRYIQQLQNRIQELAAASNSEFAATPVEQAGNSTLAALTANANRWLNSLLARIAAEPSLGEELKSLSHGLLPLSLLVEESEQPFFERLDNLRKKLARAEQQFLQWKRESRLLADFSSGIPDGWTIQGIGARAGNLPSTERNASQRATVQLADWWETSLAPGELDWFTATTPRPAYKDIFSSARIGLKQHLTLRSPTFDLTHKMVCIKSRGQGATSSVIVSNYFMREFHGLLFGDMRKTLNQQTDHGWITHSGDLNKYEGQPTFLSIEDQGEAWFELSQVWLADRRPPIEVSPLAKQLLSARIQTASELLDHLATNLAAATVDYSQQNTAPEQIELLRCACQVSEQLGVPAPWLEIAQLSQVTAELKAVDAKTPEPTRLLAISEGTPRDARVAIGGNPHQLGNVAERGCLTEVIDAQPISDDSSGRRELAKSLTSGEHPLAARVMVNRIWHHLMGRGLVSSTDNFGVLGGRPSHPELLDYLATEFMRHDWSIKWLVREIMLSRTYRLSSQITDQQRRIDPDGRLLSHRVTRRLTAESLRDSLLLVAGQLNRQLNGPSIPVHLTDQMTGRGRPASSGPLDGHGRRSIFVEVRRNFLNPFLLAFDFPMPSTTVGKRNRSNVPAQALSLLNDPFVLEMVDRWAERTSHMADAEQRIQLLFSGAYSRKASQAELQACLALVESNSPQAWRDLAHVLINSKEFSFVR